MHSLQIDPCGGDRFQWHDRVDWAVAADPRQHRLQSLGSLRMSRTGEMFEVRGMCAEQHGHICDATVQCE